MVSENFDELEVHAPAKINLSLKVVGKAKNGYHLLKSYIIFADLKDKIIIKKSTKNVFHVKGVFKNNLLQNGGETLIKKTLVWCQGIDSWTLGPSRPFPLTVWSQKGETLLVPPACFCPLPRFRTHKVPDIVVGGPE